jgi:hypothetical protein
MRRHKYESAKDLTALNGTDDFDLVAFLKLVEGMLGTGHDGFVAFSIEANFHARKAV